ncbi:MAG: glutaredoxin family protein [Ardenticatenaceae bacterium]
MTSVSKKTRPHARLFTRDNCSLCERVYPILARLAAEGLLTVERIDIASDPTLMQEYGYRIPVLHLSTGHTYEGRISEFRLRRTLANISL